MRSGFPPGSRGSKHWDQEKCEAVFRPDPAARNTGIRKSAKRFSARIPRLETLGSGKVRSGFPRGSRGSKHWDQEKCEAVFRPDPAARNTGIRKSAKRFSARIPRLETLGSGKVRSGFPRGSRGSKHWDQEKCEAVFHPDPAARNTGIRKSAKRFSAGPPVSRSGGPTKHPGCDIRQVRASFAA
ncbi:Methylcrotonyl-CoA carboxylase biotin-containing subunit [Sinorhizobium fredii CCBAU 83666]|nr:Methylcrotonyl-CoA carboxylase biotin-containing subunit [Sinorhizobium fredii CCBAU 83666]